MMSKQPKRGATAASGKQRSAKRALKLRLMGARTERQARMTPDEAIALCRAEKALAMQRWAQRGSTPITSGRHPLTGPVTRQSA